MFVIHVTVKDGQLDFNPAVEEIRMAWSMFADVLSVSAYKSLHSSAIVFELIKQPAVMTQPDQQSRYCDHIPFVKVLFIRIHLKKRMKLFVLIEN